MDRTILEFVEFIDRRTRRLSPKKLTFIFVVLCSSIFFLLIFLRKPITLSDHHQCLPILSEPSTSKDAILLAIADEGRVDLKSSIYPISLMRKYTKAKIILFIEQQLYTNNQKFFQLMKSSFDLILVPFVKPKVFIANYRIKLYYDYLLENKFDRVIHCDVSDVYFQTDIFRYIPRNRKLIVFREGCESTILLNDEKNKNWYKECYPDMKGLDKTSVIINAGIISGGYETMIKYTQLVWKLMEENKHCDIAKFGPDQAVVEYAYHNGMLDSMIDRIESGPVYCNYHHVDGQYLYFENNCKYPFIHGRPPFYPESFIEKGLQQYKELVKLSQIKI